MLIEGLDWKQAIAYDEVVTPPLARAIKCRETAVLYKLAKSPPLLFRGMRFDLDRPLTDPVLLQKILRKMAEVMALERAELQAVNATVKAHNLKLEKLENRLARLLRV